MLFKFIPNEMKFFDLFDEQGKNILAAASHFKTMAEAGRFDDAGVQRMRDIEHEGDSLTHETIDTLNRTFITPFDREDIHALTCELDDVTDFIHAVTTRIRLYKLDGRDEHIVQFADVVTQSTAALAKAVGGLRDAKRTRRILDFCIEVNRLENVGDQLREASIANLFETEKDPIAVIKRKEIYESLEALLDKCEDVVNIVEGILVKQG